MSTMEKGGTLVARPAASVDDGTMVIDRQAKCVCARGAVAIR